MRKGKLSKSELHAVERVYLLLSASLAALPDDPADKDAIEVRRLLVDSRRPLGDLLRWQDFGSTWQRVKDQ